jgi:hypothetical protein
MASFQWFGLVKELVGKNRQGGWLAFVFSGDGSGVVSVAELGNEGF